MKRIFLLISLCVFFLDLTHANLVIYKAGASIITGTWQSNGTLTQTSSNSPYEGTQHYQFAYNFSNYWAGVGLNMDNWGSGAPINFSGNTHIRLAYRGMNSDHTLKVMLRNASVDGNQVAVSGANATYQVFDIALTSCTAGTSLDLNTIREMDVFVNSNSAAGSGTVYLDAIELVNLAPPPVASADAWTRAAALGKGFNTANWLEAYWLLPSNFPVFNDYTRSIFKFFKDAGFQHARLPVIFERLGSTTPPYTLNTSHVAFQLVDSAILWANTFDLKLIIDNHHGINSLTDANFTTETPRLCKVWRQLAQRYASLDANRFMFELYNEPGGISNNNLRTVFQTVMDTVRKYDVNHTYILGGNSYNSSSGLAGFTPINDPNMIYTMHSYNPFQFTHQQMSWTTPPNMPARAFPIGNDASDVRNEFFTAQQWSSAYQYPVYLGEFGASTAGNTTSRCNFISLITHVSDSLGMSWAYWDAKNWNDAFGIFTGGVLSQANVVPCIAAAMGIFQSPLAVQDIERFSADCNASEVKFSWSARIYDSPGVFSIEGSADGMSWKEKARLDGKLSKDLYSLSVKETNGESYFRLKYQDDKRNQYESEIITTDCNRQAQGIIAPNPVVGKNKINLFFTASTAADGILKIIDMNGRTVQSQSITMEAGANSIPIQLESALNGGIYFVQVVEESGRQALFSTKLVIMN